MRGFFQVLQLGAQISRSERLRRGEQGFALTVGEFQAVEVALVRVGIAGVGERADIGGGEKGLPESSAPEEAAL